MYLPLQINLLLFSLHPSSSPFLFFTSLLCSDIFKQILNIVLLPISLLNVSLKNKAFSSHNHNIIITPTKLSIIPEHHLIISCGQFFPMISKMSFQGSCSNQDPNQVHTLSLVAVFLTSVSFKALVGLKSAGSSPVLLLLQPSLFGADLYYLLLSPGQTHTTRALSSSPCTAWPVPQGPWDLEVTVLGCSLL